LESNIIIHGTDADPGVFGDDIDIGGHESFVRKLGNGRFDDPPPLVLGDLVKSVLVMLFQKNVMPPASALIGIIIFLSAFFRLLVLKSYALIGVPPGGVHKFAHILPPRTNPPGEAHL
jgi:hypothetical protein